jgi:hypothetical protein
MALFTNTACNDNLIILLTKLTKQNKTKEIHNISFISLYHKCNPEKYGQFTMHSVSHDTIQSQPALVLGKK